MVLGIDPLGLGGRQAAKMLRREATWSGGPVQARARSQVTASTYTAAAMGGGVAATEVILSLILTILVVTRRRVSECVIVGSESMRVCTCGCV